MAICRNEEKKYKMYESWMKVYKNNKNWRFEFEAMGAGLFIIENRQDFFKFFISRSRQFQLGGFEDPGSLGFVFVAVLGIIKV